MRHQNSAKRTPSSLYRTNFLSISFCPVSIQQRATETKKQNKIIKSTFCVAAILFCISKKTVKQKQASSFMKNFFSFIFSFAHFLALQHLIYYGTIFIK